MCGSGLKGVVFGRPGRVVDISTLRASIDVHVVLGQTYLFPLYFLFFLLLKGLSMLHARFLTECLITTKARWIQYLSPMAPTLAFHASINHSFGKGSLIQLLRQFSVLHSDRKQISVGFIGYPNVGKSSVINCLKKSKVCNVAPIPGETKIWQYIALMRRIYLIDCPGVVPTSAHDSETETVLKGVVRVENLSSPSEFIPALLARVRPIYLSRTYELPHPSSHPTYSDLPSSGAEGEGAHEDEEGSRWTADAFLEVLARKTGKLLKGGEPDRETVAKMVLNDWIRGKIPFFVRPPERSGEEAEKAAGMTAKKMVKGDKGEEKRILGVQQQVRKIPVNTKFAADDRVPREGDVVPDEDEGVHSASADNDDEVPEDLMEEEDDAQSEELKWDDVYGAVDGAHAAGVLSSFMQSCSADLHCAEGESDSVPPPQQSLPPAKDIISDVENEESDEERWHKKAPRMTTNKVRPRVLFILSLAKSRRILQRKATNFFTNTNVKNKNPARRGKKLGVEHMLKNGKR
jgi:nuclear GTP-binding protein